MVFYHLHDTILSKESNEPICDTIFESNKNTHPSIMASSPWHIQDVFLCHLGKVFTDSTQPWDTMMCRLRTTLYQVVEGFLTAIWEVQVFQFHQNVGHFVYVS